MSTTATAPASLDHDLTCGGCDYNLRGLPPDGTCPECGHDVTATLRGRSRKQAAWLGRAGRGSMLIGAGLLIGGAGVAAWAAWMPWDGRWLLYPFPCGAVIAAIGTWLFAARAPHERGWLGQGRSVALRVLGIATAALQLYGTAIVARGHGVIDIDIWLPYIGGRLDRLAETTAAVWAVTAALTMWRAAGIARRVGDRPGRVQAYAIGICVAGLMGWGVTSWSPGVDRFVVLVYLVALSVVTGWSIVFFLGFAIVMRRGARAAGGY